MRRTLFEIATLIALGIISRLVPHPPNMTAMGAIALKARARFGVYGIAVPLVSMLLSDVIVGFYNWKLLVSVYASFALVSMCGALLKRASSASLLMVSGLSSVVFFLITNAVVWASSTWYPHSVDGLVACYIAGMPFLYPMFVGDIAFSLALFRVPSVVSFLPRMPQCARRVSVENLLLPRAARDEKRVAEFNQAGLYGGHGKVVIFE